MNINCITGGNDYLYKHIQHSLHKAKSIDIIVSFLMESGVKLLREDLLELQEVPIRILTGNYLNITQPSALYLLKDILGENLDLRFYNNSSVSFHPKAYIFNYKDGGEIFIGSSNLSQSALTKGIEWNYRIDKNDNPKDFNYFKDQFEYLFNNKSIIVNDQELEAYSKKWRKPKLISSENSQEKIVTSLYEKNKTIELFQPRGAQIEALYNLKKTRAQGNKKGLIIAATGIGKTYLAAFDSVNFNRILFIAHREEILNQAYETFKNVRTDKIEYLNIQENDSDYKYMVAENEELPLETKCKINMGFFTGDRKDTKKDIIFASVQTLGKVEYLNEMYFSKEYFDYIIIDEFHHAVTKNYQNIINYFEPKFLLGLTATPNRLDNKDVFSICGNNVVYDVDLNTAINKGWLVPFRYYGIYDDSIDYDVLAIQNGFYEEKELEKALSIHKRANLILKNYNKYDSQRAIGFCTSKNHARYMAEYFVERGVSSVAVYSGGVIDEYSEDRKKAIERLKQGDIKVIFCVDMFNEGVDIKDIDLVMFLRPTESQTIFLQQLGRGLRIAKNKRYLNVLDFIGNYKKAYLKPYFLANKNESDENDFNKLLKDDNYPEDCLVKFDFRIIDLFEHMKNKKQELQKSENKQEKYNLQFVLRDERVNVFAMTKGANYLKYNYEVMLCKKKKLPQRPYLLDVKKSNSSFSLSQKGRDYQNFIKDESFKLKYVAFIDSYIKIKVKDSLFKNLYKNELFSTWIPNAPIEYFKGIDEGYIIIFRVYELKNEIDEKLLEKGRSGRNSFFGLSESVNLNIKKPVLDDLVFLELKNDILDVIKKSNAFIECEEVDYQSNVNYK